MPREKRRPVAFSRRRAGAACGVLRSRKDEPGSREQSAQDYRRTAVQGTSSVYDGPRHHPFYFAKPTVDVIILRGRKDRTFDASGFPVRMAALAERKREKRRTEMVRHGAWLCVVALQKRRVDACRSLASACRDSARHPLVRSDVDRPFVSSFERGVSL